MSLRSALLRLTAEAVMAPLLTTISNKVGEAVGDILGYHINPPSPSCTECGEDMTPDHWCQGEDESATD